MTPKSDKYSLKETIVFPKPRVLAIGSSTGGSKALEELFSALRGRKIDIPILVTQHIPENFSDSLVEQISSSTDIPCVKALDGVRVESGKIYIAPGGVHMLLEERQNEAGVFIKYDNGPQVNFCKPAVDPMLDSIVEIYKKSVFAVILTGMGSDGLNSCKNVVKTGGVVIAQDEETSVVWGMPGAVAKAGLCSAVLPIPKIAEFLIKNSMGVIR